MERKTEFMDCPKCKKELIDGCTFCPVCGYELSRGKRGLPLHAALGISEQRKKEICGIVTSKKQPEGKHEIIEQIVNESRLTTMEKCYCCFGAGEVIGNPLSVILKNLMPPMNMGDSEN